jgi:integral membrane protein
VDGAKASAILRRVRWVGVAEGASYLSLLGIAMPLKYLADMPLAVKWVGWAHGLLFIAYGAAVLHATVSLRWSFARLFGFFVAALVPFGPFIANHRLASSDAAAPPSP